MILWNTKELSNQLSAGIVTEKEKMKYFLISSLVTVFTIAMVTEEKDLMLPLHYGFLGVNLLITALGIWWAFRMNAQGDNKNFLDRIVVLSIPIFLRVIVLSVVVTLPLGIVLEGSDKVMEQLFWHIVEAAVNLAFYWRLCVWINRTASPATLA
jgi:hypothetical protein